MIGGKPTDFLDRIYPCQDTVYIYDGIKYWFQGYMPNEKTVHMEVFQYNPLSEGYVWEHNGSTVEECQKAFIGALIFGWQRFWEAESDIQ